jgi:hypothetical protein
MNWSSYINSYSVLFKNRAWISKNTIENYSLILNDCVFISTQNEIAVSPILIDDVTIQFVYELASQVNPRSQQE